MNHAIGPRPRVSAATATTMLSPIHQKKIAIIMVSHPRHKKPTAAASVSQFPHHSLAVGIGGFCSASNMGLAIISQCLQPGSCLPSEQAIGFGTQAASGARSAIRAQVAHSTQATPP